MQRPPLKKKKNKLLGINLANIFILVPRHVYTLSLQKLIKKNFIYKFSVFKM